MHIIMHVSAFSESAYIWRQNG